MLFQDQHNLQDDIIAILRDGPRRTTDLIGQIQKKKVTTKQGVYDALRVLKRQGVVAMKNKVVALHVIWLKNLNYFVNDALKGVSEASTLNTVHFANLDEGEKIQYTFKNFEEMSDYDDHVAISIVNLHPPSVPVYHYAPRRIYSYKNWSKDHELLQDYTEHNRSIYILMGCTSSFDKEVLGQHESKYLQYYFIDKPLFPDLGYYFGVVGDYVNEFKLDQKLVKSIEEFYNQPRPYTAKGVRALHRALQVEGKHKFIINRNSHKAKRLRKKFGRYFYIPKRKL